MTEAFNFSGIFNTRAPLQELLEYQKPQENQLYNIILHKLSYNTIEGKRHLIISVVAWENALEKYQYVVWERETTVEVLFDDLEQLQDYLNRCYKDLIPELDQLELKPLETYFKGLVEPEQEEEIDLEMFKTSHKPFTADSSPFCDLVDKIPTEPTKAPRIAPKEPTVAEISLKHIMNDRSRQREVYNFYLDNVKRSEELRAAVTLALNNGENPLQVLPMCLEAIYRMTDDKAFLETTKQALKKYEIK